MAMMVMVTMIFKVKVIMARSIETGNVLVCSFGAGLTYSKSYLDRVAPFV